MAVFNVTMAAAVVAQGIHQGGKTAMIMGGVIGSLFAAAGYLIQTGQEQIGYGLASITSVALCGRMSQYAITTGQFKTPRGVMAALSGLASIYNISKLVSLRK